MMARMAYKAVWNDKFLKDRGLDGFLRVPMSEESFTVPDELRAAMKEVYYSSKGVNQAERGPIHALIKELKKHDDILLQFVEKDLIVHRAMEQLESFRAGAKESSTAPPRSEEPFAYRLPDAKAPE